MILIVGGACQGKRRFALEQFISERPEVEPVFPAESVLAAAGSGELISTAAGPGEPVSTVSELGKAAFSTAGPKEASLEEQLFLDGGKVSWEEFREGNYVCNLHQMIRRRLEEGEDPEKLEMTMAKELLERSPGRIIITDEIGYGIVPADRREREYRELTGRICCRLAAKAEQVWRVVAGLGMRIR